MAGSRTCETCGRAFWPIRDRHRYACAYCGWFPEQVRLTRLDHRRYPRTRTTRPVPVYDDAQCTCPREEG